MRPKNAHPGQNFGNDATRTMPLVTGAIGFFCGVLAASFSVTGIPLAILSFLLSLAITITAWIDGTRTRSALLITLAFVAFGTGLLRFELARHPDEEHALDAYVGTTQKLSGVIVREPELRESSQRVIVEVAHGDASTRMIITAPLRPRFSYGDVVVMEGIARVPESFSTDSGNVFDYGNYLAKDRIYYQMFDPAIEVIDQNKGNIVKALLYEAKRSFLQSVGKLVREPESSLLGGIVVGAQASIGDALLEDFRRVGLVHIVVLSGYNVTIVAAYLERVAGFMFRRQIAVWVGVFGIALFTIMTGASATTIRAAIMATLVVVAGSVHRRYDITRALVLAAVGMILINPRILAFDPSFQLSFAATVGLIYGTPHVERFLRFMPTWLNLRNLAASTVATQLAVLPLLLAMTGLLSLVALPVNLLVLPIVPVTMAFGFVAGIVGMIAFVIAIPAALVTELLLSYILLVTETFSSFPFAAITFLALPFRVVVFLYALLGGVFVWISKKQTRRGQ